MGYVLMRGPDAYVYDTKVLTLHPRDGISCRHKATTYVYEYSSFTLYPWYLFNGRRYTHGRLPRKKINK